MKELNDENKNLEILNAGERNESLNDRAVILNSDGLKVGKNGNVFIGKLNIFIEPFKKRHKKFYQDSKFHLIADILFVLVILSLVIFTSWVIWGRKDKNILLEIKSLNEKMISGQLNNLEITYANKEKHEIEDAKISLTIPDNFILVKVTPEDFFDKKTNTFSIGNLASGANGRFKIEGIPLADIGGHQALSASLNYKKNDKFSNQLSSFSYFIDESSLKISTEIPGEIYKDSEFEGIIKLKNDANIDWGEVILEIDPAFQIKKANATIKNNSLHLDELKSGHEKDIKFDALVEKEGRVSFRITSFTTFDGKKIKQETFTQEVDAKSPEFKVKINSEKKVINNEDEIVFSVSFDNQEQEEVKDVRIILSSLNDNFEINDFSLEENAFFKLIPSKNSRILLARNIKPGARGEIKLKLKTLRKNVGIEDVFRLKLGISYNLNDTEIFYRVSSAPLKATTNYNVNSAAYYYGIQGDQLGIGPLPPMVDIPTNYWVFWEIENRGNDLKDFTMSAHLPKNVILTGNKSLMAGSMKYSHESNLIIWKIDQIGKSGEKFRASFEIGVTPKAQDVGKVLKLLTGINFKGYDAFSEVEVAGSLKDLSTDLEFDKLAKDLNKVTE